MIINIINIDIIICISCQLLCNILFLKLGWLKQQYLLSQYPYVRNLGMAYLRPLLRFSHRLQLRCLLQKSQGSRREGSTPCLLTWLLVGRIQFHTGLFLIPSIVGFSPGSSQYGSLLHQSKRARGQERVLLRLKSQSCKIYCPSGILSFLLYLIC